jgi:mannose-6-phosphate isomerase-like protein (cupin superfamily)
VAASKGDTAAMEVTSLATAEPFTTKDGSTIRELHHTEEQSLAEARLEPGQATERHYHARTEEIYFLLDGEGRMEIDGDTRAVAPGDAILIPAGARHQIRAETPLRFLCCCAPPYSHDDTYFD